MPRGKKIKGSNRIPRDSNDVDRIILVTETEVVPHAERLCNEPSLSQIRNNS